jgi:iduronate 2-sulfatase
VQQRRDAIRAYYASIAFLDVQVGKLLDALDRLKLADDTAIVFWGDHGYQLGEHGQWMKQTVFENSARVPLLIGGAGVSSRGRGSPRTVEFLDLYPTLADLCGLEGSPKNLHGRSLQPLLAKPDAAWDKPAITQVRRPNPGQQFVMGYSLRTERYRYSMWGTEGDSTLGMELYDYKTDPRELRNLAGDRQSDPLRGRLHAQLTEILRTRRSKSA